MKITIEIDEEEGSILVGGEYRLGIIEQIVRMLKPLFEARVLKDINFLKIRGFDPDITQEIMAAVCRIRGELFSAVAAADSTSAEFLVIMTRNGDYQIGKPMKIVLALSDDTASG